MRWDALFADLQAQWEDQRHQDLEAETVEAVEIERARMPLADRLRAHTGSSLQLELPSAGRIECEIGEVGSDWLSGQHRGRSILISLDAVLAVHSLGWKAKPEASVARRRLSITSPLRALAQHREEVTVTTASAGPPVEGVLYAAGQDHFDLADQQRRLTIPVSALVMLRSRRY
ncbi:hypothetical protein HGQ17_12730 [Nesterenkonia sp. MY13]|uniref:Uncharacterized protein n=1 Tax=Nesterenkonia sedimenti TaxID=1463632 RepID=A0A7X8YEY3_9MICC|nr:hypothetical protein [Nesterenkonia sedimenti]NLS10841.1 hypothetical protein [Nesterenkonia sedimenti]